MKIEPKPPPARPLAWLLLGIVFGLPASALGLALLLGPPSPETAVFVLSLWGMTSGMLARRTRRVVVFTFCALLVLGYRVLTVGQTANVESDHPMLAAVVPERDLAILAFRAQALRDRMDPRPAAFDTWALDGPLRQGYAHLRLAEGPVPSGVLPDWLSPPTEDAAPELRVAPPRVEAAGAAMVFLHGYGGSWTLPCWQMAQGALAARVDVVCPSTTFDGRWDTAPGTAILRQTLARLERKGVRRVYLAGLSEGARAASRLAPSLPLHGLILVSGADPVASPPGVPTLVLHGEADPIVPVARAAAYARRRDAVLVTHEAATHGLLLEAPTWVAEQIEGFLRQHEPAVQ